MSSQVAAVLVGLCICPSSAWSPDGTRLAYECFDGMDWEICKKKPDNARASRVTDNQTDDYDPDWQPLP